MENYTLHDLIAGQVYDLWFLEWEFYKKGGAKPLLVFHLFYLGKTLPDGKDPPSFEGVVGIAQVDLKDGERSIGYRSRFVEIDLRGGRPGSRPGGKAARRRTSRIHG